MEIKDEHRAAILQWFRTGWDTLKIAQVFGAPEHVIATELAKARDDERNKSKPAIPAVDQSPVARRER